MIRNGLNRSDVSTPECREQARRYLVNVGWRRAERIRAQGRRWSLVVFLAFCLVCGVGFLWAALR